MVSAPPVASTSGRDILVAQHLEKRYGAVRALVDASLVVRAGEVHGLAGANGAGKSTLIKLFAGAETLDSGTLTIDGQLVGHFNERISSGMGLRFIHQHIGIVPRLTVAENVFLGADSVSGPFVVAKRLRMAASEVLSDFVDVDPAARMDSLSLSQRGLVAIARACMGDPKLVVMDEPTVSLSMPEVEKVFRAVHKMRERGIGVLFVSHRLPEVLEHCDRVTVMRDGRTIATHDIGGMTQRTLVDLITGEKDGVASVAAAEALPRTSLRAKPVMEVRGLVGGPLRGVSFDVAAGEVVGLAGLVGSGRTSTLEQIFGLRRPAGGEVTIDGRPLRPGDTTHAVTHHIAMVPEDRNAIGLVPNRSIRENTVLAHLSRFRVARWLPVPSKRKERSASAEQIAGLGIRATGTEQRVSELSGGNAQKVVVSRWLCSVPPRVLLLDEPTKGIDAAGKVDLYRVIRHLSETGVGIVVVSSDLEELAAVAQRAVVLVEGESVAELAGPLSEQMILDACYGAIERMNHTYSPTTGVSSP